MLYHVSRNGQNYGPYTLEDLQRYVTSGNVLPTDLAKSDEMADWIPVSQVLGAAYGGGVPAYPATAVVYPDPPNLHWALVLVIGMFTCGIFSIVWMFVQAAWMRKVNPNSKALFYYIGVFVLYLITIGAEVAMMIANKNGTPASGITALYGVCALASFVMFLMAIFTMRSDMEQHFTVEEPIGLSLSGVMTFFFSLYYFQYHFTRINELKRAARYRGAQI
jgi:xanthine/uracil permease